MNGTTLALAGWLTLLGLAAWRPARLAVQGAGLAVLAAGLALLLSPFWRRALTMPGEGGAVLAGPEAAFLSVWILALLAPARSFRPRIALIAAAALGLALDALAPVQPFSTHWMILGLAGPGLAGLALARLATPDRVPWDYPAWFAGLLTLTPAAQPWLTAPLPLAGTGVWILLAVHGVFGLAYPLLTRAPAPAPLALLPDQKSSRLDSEPRDGRPAARA